jgi:endoglucanase
MPLLRTTGLLLSILLLLSGLTACNWNRSRQSTPPVATTTVSAPDSSRIIQESWTAYRSRFIQGDGRVIDWEAEEKSTSEGQAYALWRAVSMDDADTFEKSLRWAESNLQRKDAQGKPTDSLWAWKWGKNPSGQWIQLDPNFASDADIDACFALILASKKWNRSDYLVLAKTKLKDLWNYSTVEVKSKRYLLPGPAIAFRKGNLLTLNPSYLAPYAFRLFAQVDGDRDWMSLVDSSYEILEQSATLSQVGLPSDWVNFDSDSGKYSALQSGSPLSSHYGFDASRVWWRVALDAALFNETRALTYLRTHLKDIEQRWQNKRKIPAQIDLSGQPKVDYDSTSQYGMLYLAFAQLGSPIAQEIYQQKLMPSYRSGFWDNDRAYYTQNLAWFGIAPVQDLSSAMAGFFPENRSSQKP